MRFSLPILKKKEERFLTLDIGTEAVKALIFQKENEKIIIFGASLEYFDRFGVFDSKDFEKDVIKKTISKALQNFAPQNFGRVLLGLPATILKGRVIFQNFCRENPKEIIKEKEEGEILEQVLKEGKGKIAQKFAENSDILAEDIHFINLKILEIKIDGYEIPILRGYQGKNLDFRILATFLPKYYLKNIEDIVQARGFKNLKIVQEAEGLTSIFKNYSDGIFLDLGGRITQIFLVKNGKLEEIGEFEIGGETFSQILSQNLGLKEEEARVFKEKYSEGLFSVEVRKRIREIFSEEVENWFQSLKLKLRNQKILPSTIFLFGGGSLLPEIPKILEKGNWQSFPFIPQPKIKLFLPKNLKNIEDRTESLNSPQDIAPLLFCLS